MIGQVLNRPPTIEISTKRRSSCPIQALLQSFPENDSLADEAVRSEPVSAVCQPVDTLAAVDKAVVDSRLQSGRPE
jgi:hypothetical protein